MPLLECASGHVYLAHASDEERRNIIEGLERLHSRSPLLPLFKSGRPVTRIQEDGYATYERNPHTPNPGKTSSISVPIFDKDYLAGALTMAFFASAMPVAEAVKRHLADLKATAAAIGDALRAPPVIEATREVVRGTRRPTKRREVAEG